MKNQKKRYLVCIGVIVLLSFAILASCVSSLEQVDTADLHVASPDWREQILYFILTDRFNDGNPKNSNQKKGEYDPLSEAKYQGGDLQGIIDKIDYIKGLGATAIWITPPVANQWWDPMVNYGGYHGYWAENLVKVDKHLGTLNDYKRLSATLHQNGMYLVQDIVPNHMGNYFRITEIAGAPKFFLNKDSVPIKVPTQKPFNMVDMNNPKHKEADIYHWTGNISDENSDYIRHNYQLSDLDDLNTENPAVIEALKESYGYWIQEVGVDGFRVDTAKYVPMEFWRDFFHGDNGILEQARKTGREDFTAFGEAWFGSTPFSDTADRAIASYRGR
ncbi:MAG TPA: alpha-amylase, partial [Treponema sp.]|nr:alpha-amylase [Treponema sp.]